MSKNEDQIRSYYTNLAKDNNGIYSYWGCALLRSSRRVRRWELKSYPDLPCSRGSAICLFMKSSFGLAVASALMVAGTMVVVDLCPLFPPFLVTRWVLLIRKEICTRGRYISNYVYNVFRISVFENISVCLYWHLETLCMLLRETIKWVGLGDYGVLASIHKDRG